MKAHPRFLSAFCLLCLVWSVATANAQGAGNNSQLDSLRQLLLMPAPTPRLPNASPDQEIVTTRATPVLQSDKAPPDDAPLPDLIGFWLPWANSTSGKTPKPSSVVRERLLVAAEAEPENLPGLLPLFADTAATADRIKRLYDSPGNERLNDEWRKTVREWLKFHSKYFLNDLLALARKAKDKDSYVSEVEALKALARVDWQTAEPLLLSLAGGDQPRTAAVALTLLYQHAQDAGEASAEERYRLRLQTIVADRLAPAYARDAALEILSLTKWSGRDEWYLSLFEDETLIAPHDGHTGFNPLQTPVSSDPDYWIPIMAKLVEGSNQTVRSGAASCLMIFQLRRARKDALQPLLPWLSNPAWASDKRDHRLRLIQSMEEIDLPESVPGLIWVVENDKSVFNRSYAAESLARYKDARAAPALRNALLKESNEDDRRRFIQGLFASGGLTEVEQLDALEAYAAKLTTPDGREQVEGYRSYGAEALPVPVSVGIFLARKKDAPDTLVRALLSRAERLKRENPQLARTLVEVAHHWQSRQVDLDLVARIADGIADAETIVQALKRRITLRESVGPELQSLAGAGGAAAGVAAVLLGNENLALTLVGSGNQEGQIALLACARLTQMPLPVEAVGNLLQSKNDLLALAAERYLLVEDSQESQRLLWEHHPNEAFITGWRENTPWMVGDNFDSLTKQEEKLRKEFFTAGSPLEILALIYNGAAFGHVLRIYPDKAVYTRYTDRAYYLERVISKSELQSFRNAVGTNELSTFGPLIGPCHHDCSVTEFLSLTRQRGRRVFSHQGFSGTEVLSNAFDLLARGEDAKTHFYLEKEIKGLEILFSGEELTVLDVWQRGPEVRIFVERKDTDEHKEDHPDADQEDQMDAAERRRRRLAREKARFSWRVLQNRVVGPIVAQPDGYSNFDENEFEVEEETSRLDHSSLAVAGKFVVQTRNFDGLWKKEPGSKAVKISGNGAYANPVTTPDGRWVVVAKTDNDWGQPNYVVRFDLQTGREFRVDVPAADQFDPIAFVAAHGKVLLRREKDDEQYWRKTVGPESPEYYLLDVANGEARLAEGIFAPLLQDNKRILQPTGRPEEVWAAIPKPGNQTEVGRYNLKDFSFQLILRVPHLTFDSDNMSVDADGGKLYVVYKGQLLRLPFPTAR